MSVHSNYDANSNKFIEYMDKLPQVPGNKDFKEGIDILNKNSKAIFDTFQALQEQIKSGRTPAGIKGKLLKFDTLLSTLLGYKEAEGINGMIQKALSQTRACITALQVKLPNSSAAQKETAAAPSNTAVSNVNKFVEGIKDEGFAQLRSDDLSDLQTTQVEVWMKEHNFTINGRNNAKIFIDDYLLEESGMILYWKR